MPWSGGTYTLPAGTNVVAGNDIEASWANALTVDLQTGINSTLNRDGSNNMTAAVPQIDGTISVPGISFANEPSSGWYRAAAEDIRFSLLGTAQYKWTKGTAPNYIPVFSVWDQANTAWKAMPHAFSATTVAGAWTFESTATFETTTTFEGNVTVEDVLTQWTSSAADEERVYIDQNDVRMYTDGDTPGPNNGAGAFKIYTYNGSSSWRQYVLGKTNTVTSDGSFRLIAYETDGSAVRDTVFKYDWTNKDLFFDTDIDFGKSSAVGNSTINAYDVFNVKSTLDVEGPTSTENIVPSSATFKKGLDSEMAVRVWNQAGTGYPGSVAGTAELQWGHTSTGSSGSYVTGDFKMDYSLGTVSSDGGLQLRRYNPTGATYYFPSIFYFNADTTMNDSYFNIYYRTRIHNITGHEGRGLLAEDMDNNWKQAGWLLSTETSYTTTDTIPQNDEARNIIAGGSSPYTLTLDPLEDGTWVRVLNVGTATVTLDAGVAAGAYFVHLDGTAPVTPATMDLASGGWCMIFKRASITYYVIYGQGLS